MMHHSIKAIKYFITQSKELFLVLRNVHNLGILVEKFVHISEDIPTPYPKKNPPTPKKVHISVSLTV